jgi:ribosomal RNA-processing protein 12
MIKTGSFGGGPASTNANKNWPSKLTAESLLKHQTLLGEDVDSRKSAGMNDDDDALTLGQTEKTFETFASDWTQCTNVSFGKLMRSFSTNNAHHREMLVNPL